MIFGICIWGSDYISLCFCIVYFYIHNFSDLEERKLGRTIGRTVDRLGGRTDGRAFGRADGWAVGRIFEWSDGRTDGGADQRTAL